jgi:hypothetical protein
MFNFPLIHPQQPPHHAVDDRLSEALQAEEKKRWELESQLNAARAQGNAREAEVTAQITAASKAKEEALQVMISESRAQVSFCV